MTNAPHWNADGWQRGGGRTAHSAESYAAPRPPVSLFGRGGHPDRFMLALERVAARIEPLTSRWRPGRRSPAPTGDLTVRVARVERPARDVAALTLVPARPGGALPRWQPGHHVDVVLGDGVVRQYSLCGDPRDRSAYRIAVRRIDGGTGSGLAHALAEGDVLTLRGPRNAFPFARADRYLFVAGGIGVTPVLPMVRAAHAAGRPFRFVYTGRSRESMPFLDTLPAPSRDADVTVRPDDEYGPPDAAELLAGLSPGTAVYVCGPAPLIDALRRRVPPGTPFFSERFSPPPVVDGRRFEVRLGRAGPVLPVPEDESALDVVLRARPETAYSCRQGFCGTCRVGLLSGEPHNRDRPTGGSPRGAGFALCVSRADEGTQLVLDL
ncbi:PDR/VanB family oxidoreductase [Nocardiopsis sp. L17-MgMaSL7]|uniref:PDR/VanB family oxidoreductase n=1 Tax=Nocardiopsis sp. L17-MgMaSL7 TaxID=1938893 RepID=UPI000D82B6EE|nr:PDR/VanB family oxidoreductase [Nocardiopsis sp. L17-MgMaSL7]PWV52886.1 ferredoxin-NADP reductase [Nocardiopsis sp. L17-MgMaSL7]